MVDIDYLISNGEILENDSKWEEMRKVYDKKCKLCINNVGWSVFF